LGKPNNEIPLIHKGRLLVIFVKGDTTSY